MLILVVFACSGLWAEVSSRETERSLSELQNGDWLVKWETMQKLVRTKTPGAADAIRKQLDTKEHPWVRGRALVSLARLEGEKILGSAITASGDQQPMPLRIAAIEALGMIGSPKGEATIRKALEELHPEIRYHAIVALARLNQADAWNAAQKSLAEKESELILAGARSLVHLDLPEAKQKVIDLLFHSDHKVQFEAAQALGRTLDPTGIAALLKRAALPPSRQIFLACEHALSDYPKEQLEAPLLDAIQSKNTSLYLLVMKLLARRPNDAVCEVLAPIAKEADKRYDRVLPSMFSLLAGHDADRYADVIASHVQNTNRTIRIAAISNLARCRKIDHYSLLKNSLLSSDAGTRSTAFSVLENEAVVTPEAGIVPFVQALLKESRADILKQVLSLVEKRLTSAELPKAIDAFGHILADSDSAIRKLAVQALSKAADAKAKEQIAAAQGYITKWMILGSFPIITPPKGKTHTYPPEKEIEFNKKYEVEEIEIGWTPFTAVSTNAKIPLHDLLFPPATDNRVAFCTAEVESAAAKEVALEIYGDDLAIIWLNGTKLGQNSKPGAFTLKAKLQKGKNRILVRIDNVKEWWWLQVRATLK